MEENSQPLATESFSYSWLTDKAPPSSDGLRGIEHWNEDEDSFHFDVPVITSPTDVVNADEIFSHGQIMPVYADRSRVKTSTSVPASPVPVYPSRSPFLKRYYILGQWRRSSKKILQKWLGFVGCSRKSSRVDDLERKVFEVQSLSNSLESSPRQSSAYSAVEWGDFDHWRSSSTNVTSSRRSSSYGFCDADENSIHEAILYCKRSIEK